MNYDELREKAEEVGDENTLLLLDEIARMAPVVDAAVAVRKEGLCYTTQAYTNVWEAVDEYRKEKPNG